MKQWRKTLIEISRTLIRKTVSPDVQARRPRNADLQVGSLHFHAD